MLLRQEETSLADSVSHGIVTGSMRVDKAARPVEEIIRDLSSRDKAMRAEAEAELAQLGPGAADALLSALAKEGAKYRKQRYTFRKSVYAGVGFVVFYLLLGVIIGVTTGKWEMLSNFGSFAGVFGALGAAAAMSPQHKSIVSLMANLDDVRSIGWLADALNSEDSTVRATAADALVRLLPKVDASSGPLLDAESRRSLDRALVKSDNIALVSAILTAYERVGDTTSLGPIDALLESRAAVRPSAVAEAAQAAANAIRARAEKEREAHLLLRAADAGENADVLLRPAASDSTNDPASLLRPAE